MAPVSEYWFFISVNQFYKLVIVSWISCGFFIVSLPSNLILVEKSFKVSFFIGGNLFYKILNKSALYISIFSSVIISEKISHNPSIQSVSNSSNLFYWSILYFCKSSNN